MIVITRFRVGADREPAFLAGARDVLAGLGGSAGFADGTLCRAVDDPQLWSLVTRWEHAGAYRRALGAFAVRVAVMGLQDLVADEPSAYEEVLVVDPEGSVGPVAGDLDAGWAADPGPIRRGRP